MTNTTQKWADLPAGVTLEMLDTYARQRENARRRADYARHPERILRNRGQQYVNFLTKHGREIWPEAQRAEILRGLTLALGGGAR